MRNKHLIILPALLVLFPLCVCCGDSLKDDAVFWVQLDVTALHEHHYRAGDPEITVHYATDISFTLYGYYTVTRMKVGPAVQYMALPGKDASGRGLQAINLGVIQSHPCQDGQSLLIGRETRNIPVNIASGDGGLTAEAATRDKVRLRFAPVEIWYEPLDCTNPDCVSGFTFEYGDNVVGWDREATQVDEYGYESDFGYVLTEVDFKTLKEVGAGVGDPALTIPISIDRSWSAQEDTPTGPELKVYTFRVNGFITAVSDGE